MHARTRFQPRLARASVAPAVLIAALGPWTGGAAATEDGGRARTVLAHHVRAAVANRTAADLGALDADRRINLVFQLPLRNESELDALLARLSDPDSPDYHRWLSVAQFTERFGRTEAEYARLAAAAEAHGLTVDYRSPSRLFLVAHGTAAAVESTLNVRMRTYQHPTEARTFYSVDREPSVDFDVPIAHVGGLNDYDRPRPAARAGVAARSGGPGATGSGPGGAFLASDMRTAYAMGTNTGKGQAVALVEFAGYNPADISAYFAATHRTNQVPIVNIVVDGGSATGYRNINDEGEVCLDIEQVLGVAPGLSQLRVYIGPESFGAGADVYVFGRIVTDNVAKQVSNSWWWSPDDPQSLDPLLKEAAAQGQTVFSISGDKGAYVGNDAKDQGFPAEDAYLTVVGGTSLTTTPAGAWSAEKVWNSYASGSGGGPANDHVASFALPSWQAGVANSHNGASTLYRNSPDVALHADYNNYICYNGGCSTNWGGTSFAAPRWAAYLALVNQQVAATKKTPGLGFINPTLYKLGQSAAYGANFHDIVSGNNQTSGQTRYYNAVVGYDLATGWGSMNGLTLMNSLVGAAQ